jgi:hypothetical protein
MWMARKAGLTIDDLCTMTYAQVDSWIELYQWSNYIPGDEDEHVAATAGQNAFFHTN